VPFEHGVQPESPRVEKVPTPQATHDDAPLDEYVPALSEGWQVVRHAWQYRREMRQLTESTNQPTHLQLKQAKAP